MAIGAGAGAIGGIVTGQGAIGGLAAGANIGWNILRAGAELVQGNLARAGGAMLGFTSEYMDEGASIDWMGDPLWGGHGYDQFSTWIDEGRHEDFAHDILGTVLTIGAAVALLPSGLSSSIGASSGFGGLGLGFLLGRIYGAVGDIEVPTFDPDFEKYDIIGATGSADRFSWDIPSQEQDIGDRIVEEGTGAIVYEGPDLDDDTFE